MGRASTDDGEATVVIPSGPLFDGLPAIAREKAQAPEPAGGAEETPEGSAGGAPAAGRKLDFVLSKPYISEWDIRITPPPGFRPEALPESFERRMGPALFTRSFTQNPDGSLSARFRFDTVKRRFTPAEFESLREAVARHLEGDAPPIHFEQVGEAHLSAGEYGEALREFRRLADLHPKEALHRVQISRTLLAAGLGEAARAEGERATGLEPASIRAWRNLGWTLQHDLIGRRFQKGFDYEGAVRAYRKAQELDAKDFVAAIDLAILLEHDRQGLRYGPGARMDEAIAEYRKVQDQTEGTDLVNNLPLVLLYAGRFAELKEFASSQKPTPTLQSFLVTVAAATGGAEAAKAEAARLIAGGEARRTALLQAGAYLMKLRLYGPSAELLAAGAQGRANGASLLAHAEAVRKARRVDSPPEKPATLDEAVRRFLWLMEFQGDLDLYLSCISRSGTPAAMDERSHSEFRRKWYGGICVARDQEIPLEVIRDLGFSAMSLVPEGDDRWGYKVLVTSSAVAVGAETYYVVKEDGAYKILGARGTSDIGKWVLGLLDRGDMDGARHWLDWARDEVLLEGGEDPLPDPPFASLWTAGMEADEDTMRIAAAALSAQGFDRALAVPILSAGYQKAADETHRAAMDLALARIALVEDRPEELLARGRRLLKAFPRSQSAFELTVLGLDKLDRWEEIRRLATERLLALPDDVDTLRFYAQMAARRREAAVFRQQVQRLIDLGEAGPGDYNQLAWNSLFDSGPLAPEALEWARKGVTLSQERNAAILHTLASVYAEMGKVAEAREVLLKVLDVENAEEPGEDAWCVLGRMAEQYGQVDAARAAYDRVKVPKNPRFAYSLYELAQLRLKLLNRSKTR